jgi:UDP:flavonoid glycosyltransferase YjiC (YdhE family)
MHFVLFPLGSHGDVHPFLGLAVRLKERGHQVHIATNAMFAELVERFGIPFHAVGSEEEANRLIRTRDVWHPTRGMSILARKIIVPMLAKQFDAARELIQSPDTVLVGSGLGFGVHCAHEAFGNRFVTLHLQPSVLWSLYESPKVARRTWLSQTAPRWIRQAQYRFGVWWMLDSVIRRDVNAWRRERGLSRVESCESLFHSPQKICGLFPEWFAPRQPDWPSQFVHTDFPLWDESERCTIDVSLQRFLDSGDPPIVFTPGTGNAQAGRFWRAAVGALERLGRRGLLLARHREGIPQALPASVQYVEYAPLSQVLPHAACLVHHGGIGTTSQAFFAGVPQLVTPFGFDQPDNATRVRRLGCGDLLWATDLNSRRLARGLSRILDDQLMRENCQNARRKMSRDQGLQMTCEVLEQLG